MDKNLERDNSYKVYNNVQDMLKYSELKITTVIGINLMSVTFLSSFAKALFLNRGESILSEKLWVDRFSLVVCILSFLMFFLSIVSAMFGLWPRYVRGNRKNYLFFRDICEENIQELENIFFKREECEWRKDIILSIKAVSEIVCIKNNSFYASCIFLLLGVLFYLVLLFSY